FLSMKYEIRQMLQAGGGAIVNNASIAGVIAEAGISTYAAAKHGVIGLSKAAALEYASKGIRINALAPGLVETAMTKPWFDDPTMRNYFMANSPIGRFAQPEEIAGMVLFLCSEFASFAVGPTFAIDGGYTAREGSGSLRKRTTKVSCLCRFVFCIVSGSAISTNLERY